MRLQLVVLGVVALWGSGCASKYRWPATVYWVDLKEPQPIELATGAKVPCGRGLAMAAHDRLLGCIIDRRATIQRCDFPAGAALCFRWDGTLERARHVERRGMLRWAMTRSPASFWSATAVETSSTTAWRVSFDSGGATTMDVGSPLYVRCVR